MVPCFEQIVNLAEFAPNVPNLDKAASLTSQNQQGKVCYPGYIEVVISLGKRYYERMDNMLM